MPEGVLEIGLGNGSVGVTAMRDEVSVVLRFRPHLVGYQVGDVVLDGSAANQDGDVVVRFANLQSAMVVMEQMSLIVAALVTERDEEILDKELLKRSI